MYRSKARGRWLWRTVPENELPRFAKGTPRMQINESPRAAGFRILRYYLRRLRSAGEDLGEIFAGVGGAFGDAVLEIVGRAAERREVRLARILEVVGIDADTLFERLDAGERLNEAKLRLRVAVGEFSDVAGDVGIGLDAVNRRGFERAREARRILMHAGQRLLRLAGGALGIFARGGAELELAGDVLEGLEDRLEGRDLGNVGIGHGYQTSIDGTGVIAT